MLGLTETRWTSSGEMKLADGTIYSGHPDDRTPHIKRVAFMLTPKALISWEPINSRLVTAKFTNLHKRIATVIIQCYTPTNDAEEEEEKKEQFYSTLSQTVEKNRIWPSSWKTLMRKLGKITPGMNKLWENTD